MAEVSVIIPSYNHARFIGETIESVLNQTFAGWELIVIDDASKDDSREVIETYRQLDSRIKTRYQDVNTGMSTVLNHAMNVASGQFLVLGGSDDIFVENMLEVQLEAATRRENKNKIIIADGVHFTGCGREFPLFSERIGANKKKSGDIFFELLENLGLYFFVQTMFIPREHVRGVQWDPSFKYLNEYRFVLELASCYQFFYQPIPVFKHRVHDKCLSLKMLGGDDDDVILHERAQIAQDCLLLYYDRLPEHIRELLYQFIISDAMKRRDGVLVKETTLKWLTLVPDTLNAVRAALLQSEREPDITLTFDCRGERMASLNLKEVGIGRQEILEITATDGLNNKLKRTAL